MLTDSIMSSWINWRVKTICYQGYTQLELRTHYQYYNQSESKDPMLSTLQSVGKKGPYVIKVTVGAKTLCYQGLTLHLHSVPQQQQQNQFFPIYNSVIYKISTLLRILRYKYEQCVYNILGWQHWARQRVA